MKNLAIKSKDGQWAFSGGGELASSSVYTSEFLSLINGIGEGLEPASDYSNELFLWFFLKAKEEAEILKKNGVGTVKIKLFANGWVNSVIAALFLKINISFANKIIYFLINWIKLCASIVIVCLASFFLPSYTAISWKKRSLQFKENLSVIRTPAAYAKLKNIFTGLSITVLNDSFSKDIPCNVSLYESVNYVVKISSLAVVPFLVIRDCLQIARDVNNMFGVACLGHIFYFYSKRIVHKCVYEYYLQELLAKNSFKVFYTGNKEDRFALVEEKLCIKHGVQSVCIPHGLEYSLRLPSGVVGDLFYCTTQKAQEFLTQLYRNKSRFIYDQDIALKMFGKNVGKKDVDGIVYFTEAREININLKIIGHLLGNYKNVYLKLHPKDSSSSYEILSNKIEYITDFDEAISNKICLARKSTVLVEAIYNHSVPAAVLIDKIDRDYVESMLPSLMDDEIKKIYTLSELDMFIANHINMKSDEYNCVKEI